MDHLYTAVSGAICNVANWSKLSVATPLTRVEPEGRYGNDPVSTRATKGHFTFLVIRAEQETLGS